MIVDIVADFVFFNPIEITAILPLVGFENSVFKKFDRYHERQRHAHNIYNCETQKNVGQIFRIKIFSGFHRTLFSKVDKVIQMYKNRDANASVGIEKDKSGKKQQAAERTPLPGRYYLYLLDFYLALVLMTG